MGRVSGFGTGSSSGFSFSRGLYAKGLVGVAADGGVGLVAYLRVAEVQVWMLFGATSARSTRRHDNDGALIDMFAVFLVYNV